MRPSVRRSIVSALAVALVTACSQATPSGSPALGASTGPAATPAPNAAGLPPLADVPFFRGDAARSAVHAGPGPLAKPELAWEHELGSEDTLFPILVDGVLIVGTDAGRLTALDGRTGMERWHFDGADAFGDSAAAADGLILVPDHHTLYAIEASTGKVRWSVPVETEATRPELYEGIVYVGSPDGSVHGFDASTGAERWAWQGPRDVSVRVDLVARGVVYAATNDGRLIAVDIAKGAEAWHFQSRASRVGAPLLAGGTIYINAVQGEASEPVGEVTAVDSSTGEVRWRFRPPSGLQAVVGPVRDGVVYVNTHADGVYALRDEVTRFSEVWHAADVPRSSWPIVLAGDQLYVPLEDGRVATLEANDGSMMWTTPGTSNGIMGPVVSGGMLFKVQRVAGVVQAWAEPSIVALLPPGRSSLSSPEPSPEIVNPFTVVQAFDWSTIEIAVPAGMEAGPDGLLYVLDTKPSVTVLDPSTGTPVRSWGRHGSGDGEFDLTRPDENAGVGDLAIGPDGLVYVADGANHRVQVFRPDGTYVDQFGSFGQGEGQFSRPFQIDVAGDGSVYVVDHDLHSLSKFDAQGGFVWRVGGAGAEDPEMRAQHGLVALPDGNLLIFPESASSGLVIDQTDGSVIDRWGPGGMGESGEPKIDGSGNIYLFQYGDNQRVEAFTPDGRLLGGIYQQPGQPGTDRLKTPVWGNVFWPAPVFTPDGKAYSFGKEGLLELKVELPAG